MPVIALSPFREPSGFDFSIVTRHMPPFQSDAFSDQKPSSTSLPERVL
jgi:hypothetical protein